MRRGVSALWTAELINRSLTAFAAVYTARVIGVETYGIVGYVAAIVSYFAVFVRFGTDTILVRDLSRAVLSTESERAAYRSVVLLLRGIFGLVCIGALAALAAGAKTPLISKLYYANAVGILGLLLPLDYFLQSERQFGMMAVFRVAFNVLNVAFILLFLHTPDSAWWIPLSGGLSLLLAQAIFFHRMEGGFVLPGARDMTRLLSLLVGESLPLFGTTFLLLLIGQFGIILVRHAATASELGLYVTAYKIYDIGNAMIVPVAVTIFPSLAEIWESGNRTHRTRTLLDGVRITVPMSLLMLGASFFCGTEALGFIFGSQYRGASPYMTILLGALLFRGISMFFANSLVAAGRQHVQLIITAFIAVLNMGLLWVFMPVYGVVSAAWINAGVFFVELIAYSAMIQSSIEYRPIAVLVLRYSASWGAACIAASFVVAAVAASDLGSLIAGGMFVGVFLGMSFMLVNIWPLGGSA